ncbi:olfactory receptor 10A7-like [Emydura macquarii macquarii]|uniref:olfactory receptor 10A7-like n=1 Tax=Emydura macquarii macquarii TaxID=1129001 RepID=UPI00352A2FE7
MAVENQTSVKAFILLGFSRVPDVLQGWLLAGVGAVYLLILLGNSLIVFITLVDAALHTPMYFFLRNLSFLEICYASVTIPRMLLTLLGGNKAISILGCATQMYFFHSLGITECFLLLAMAYDRCIAICCPLRYTFLMRRSLCLQMVAASWAAGSLVSSGHVSLVFTLPYCGPNEIDHFFCDIPPVLKLACADTYRTETELFSLIVLLAIVPLVLILVSYSQIISTILKMPSNEGKRKAFSTCSSHLIVVTLFLGTGSVVYLQPKSSSYVESNKLLSLLYTIVTPMLNPIVYGLRNEKLKGALRKSCSRS